MYVDELIPAPESVEFHSRLIDAPVERVWREFIDLPATDLWLARTLMRVRVLVLRVSGHSVPAPSHGTFLQSSPVPLLNSAAHEYVLAGGVGRPWRDGASPSSVETSADVLEFAEPGWAKIAADFRFHALGRRTLMTTETRVCTTDPRTRRRMRLYWLIIRPFSGLIRREVLTSVARRAELSRTPLLRLAPSPEG